MVSACPLVLAVAIALFNSAVVVTQKTAALPVLASANKPIVQKVFKKFMAGIPAAEWRVQSWIRGAQRKPDTLFWGFFENAARSAAI